MNLPSRRLLFCITLSLLAPGLLPGQIRVSLDPSRATLAPGQSLHFLARVRGLRDARLVWGIEGQGAVVEDLGSITQRGLYTAPRVPPSGSIQVVLTLLSPQGWVLRRLLAPVICQSPSLQPSGPQALFISPPQASLAPGEFLRFQAHLLGGQARTIVWKVYGQEESPERAGVIGQDGLYRAPAQPWRSPIKVVAMALGAYGEPLATGLASIGMAPRLPHPGQLLYHIHVEPFEAHVRPGETVSLQASVAEVRKPHIRWSIRGAGRDPKRWGRISRHGTYLAPQWSTGGFVLVTATLLDRYDEPVGVAHARIIVEEPGPELDPLSVFVSPPVLELACGQRLRFRARVAGLTHPRLRWELHGSGETPRLLGTLLPNGTYLAPAHPLSHPVRVVAYVLGPYGEIQGSAAALVTLLPALEQALPTSFTVEIEPRYPRVLAGEHIQLRAHVQGPEEGRLVWTLAPRYAREAPERYGLMGQDGRYRAPRHALPQRVLAVATLLGPWGEPLAFDNVPMVVLERRAAPVRLQVLPPAGLIPLGSSLRFQARVEGLRHPQVRFSLLASGELPRNCSLRADGLFHAPAHPPRGRITLLVLVHDRRGRQRARAQRVLRFQAPRPVAPRPPKAAHPRPAPKPPHVRPRAIPHPRAFTWFSKINTLALARARDLKHHHQQLTIPRRNQVPFLQRELASIRTKAGGAFTPKLHQTALDIQVYLISVSRRDQNWMAAQYARLLKAGL